MPHRDHALSRCHVSKLRRSRHDVADCVKIRLAGSLVSIHLHETAIELNLGVLEADIVRIRLASDRYEQLFELKLFFVAVGKSCTELDAVRILADIFRLCAGLYTDTGSS